NDGVAIAQLAASRLQARMEQLRSVVTLYRVNVGKKSEALFVRGTEGLVLLDIEIVGVMQSCQKPFGCLALGLERAVGKETCSVEGDGVFQTSSGVVKHELDRTTAGKEDIHRVRLDAGNFCEQRLEFDVGEG